MNKLWLIIRREYLIRVKKKSFIIATFLTPLAFGLLVFGSGFLASSMAEGEKTILVKDDSGIVEERYEESRDKIEFAFTDAPLEEVKENYKGQGYDFLVYIPPFEDKEATKHQIQYFSKEKLGLTTIERVENKIGSAFKMFKIEESGLDEEIYQAFYVNIDMENGLLDESSEEVKGDKSGKLSIIIGTILGGVMGFLMYMVIFIFGNMVMRSVMEEKINRIVEVMISSVKPFQLMLGKVIGVGGVGLTQLLIWIIFIPLIMLLAGTFLGDPGQAQEMAQSMGGPAIQQTANNEVAEVIQEFMSLNWWLILPSFIIFFLGGYFIYSSLFAAIGSAIGDDLGESQGLMMPIIIPVIFALMIMMSSLENPNSTMAVFGSIFPLFSPIVMPARLAFDPPLWQVFLSLGLLILTSLFFIWLSGRIYRIGILMYGKRLTFKEIWKWLLHS
jgi:ABC-2 type transport system permease protein